MLMGKALNGNIVCSIGLRYTKADEIYNICVLPLDLNYNPMFGSMFDKFVQVDCGSKLRVEDRVFASPWTKVWDQFDIWFDDHIKKGQIIPLGYDWPKVKPMLQHFFSPAGYQLQFHETPRDLKAVACFLNDQAEASQLPIPFSKTTLRYILNNCNAGLDLKYTALQMAMNMARAYKLLVCSSI